MPIHSLFSLAAPANGAAMRRDASNIASSSAFSEYQWHLESDATTTHRNEARDPTGGGQKFGIDPVDEKVLNGRNVRVSSLLRKFGSPAHRPFKPPKPLITC